MISRAIVFCTALIFSANIFAEPAHLTISLPQDREMPLVMLSAIDHAVYLSRIPAPGKNLSLEIPREGYYMLETRYPSGLQHARTIRVPAGTSLDKPFEVRLTQGEALFAEDLAAERSVVSVSMLSGESEVRKALGLFERAMETGDTGHAEKLLISLLETAPGVAIVWNNLGALRLQQKRYGEAIHCLRRARVLDDGLFEVNLNLGRALILTSMYPAAHQSALRALEIRADHPNASALAAQALFLQGRYEEAVPHVEKLLLVDPFHVSFPDLLMAAILQQRGEMHAAAGFVLSWVTKHPGHPEAADLRQRALRFRRNTASTTARAHAGGSSVPRSVIAGHVTTETRGKPQ